MKAKQVQKKTSRSKGRFTKKREKEYNKIVKQNEGFHENIYIDEDGKEHVFQDKREKLQYVIENDLSEQKISELELTKSTAEKPPKQTLIQVETVDEHLISPVEKMLVSLDNQRRFIEQNPGDVNVLMYEINQIQGRNEKHIEKLKKLLESR